MRGKLAVAIPLAIVALLASCSDQGSSPTSPGGGGVVHLSVANVTAGEGSPVAFHVALDSSAGTKVTFHWAVTMLSASSADFSGALSGDDSIPTGGTSKTITIQTVADGVPEGTEQFDFVVSSVTGASVTQGTAVGSISPSDGGFDVSWATMVQPILQRGVSSCTSCHGTNGGGFSVATPQTLQTTGTHAPNVIAFDGAGSNMIQKLSATPPFGQQMPQGGPYLSTATIDTIKMWIDQGAKDN